MVIGKSMRKEQQGKLIFLLSTFVFMSAVLVTTLLANDRKNLRLLLNRLGIAAMEAPQRIAPPEKPKPRHQATAKPPEESPAEEIMMSSSGSVPFARKVNIALPTLCTLFSRHGYEGDGWHPSMAGDFGECSGQKSMTNLVQPDAPEGSVFFLLRGRKDNEFLSLRIKILAPQNEAGEAAKRELNRALTEIIAATGWSDLEGFAQEVRQFREVDAGQFGLSASFKREFTNPDAYNLILQPAIQTPEPGRLQRPAGPRPFETTTTP